MAPSVWSIDRLRFPSSSLAALQLDPRLVEKLLIGPGRGLSVREVSVHQDEALQQRGQQPASGSSGPVTRSKRARAPPQDLPVTRRLLLPIEQNRASVTIPVPLTLDPSSRLADLAVTVWSSSQGCEVFPLAIDLETKKGNGAAAAPVLLVQIQAGYCCECLDILVSLAGPGDAAFLPIGSTEAVFVPPNVARQMSIAPAAAVSDLCYLIGKACRAETTPLALSALQSLLSYLK